MSQEDGTVSLDLVEARVHLAAAQYHNSLANGKLIPRPPSAPRSRPASAGAAGRQAPARPWSAQSVHSCPSQAPSAVRRAELLEAQRMDSATDALAVLLGPWGNCCYQAPPGVITTTLHDIADMLRISATRRDRRKMFIMNSQQKFLPRSPESLERLHASIIGRALGRSFANVLLLTKVLMAFREALHTSELHSALSQRTRWLQSEKSQVDQRCLDLHFYAWLHHSQQSLQRRDAEAEILRGREALVQVYSQGREELAKAVDFLFANRLEQLLVLCLSAWRDAMRLSSLEGYGYHLVSMRQRTPQLVHGLFLSRADEACLMVCLVCWAASVALQRQGRVLQEREASLQKLKSVAEQQQQQLEVCRAQKEHLRCNSWAFISRTVQRADRQLLESAWNEWWRLNQVRRHQRCLLQSNALRRNLMALRQGLQAWQLWVSEQRRKSHAWRQGLRAVARWEEQQRWVILSEWARVMREHKAEDLLRCKGERRRLFAERRFHACATQQLCWLWDAWRQSVVLAAERAQRIQRAVKLGEERLESQVEAMVLRLMAAWHLEALKSRQRQKHREVHLRQERAMNEALHHAELALRRCQEPGSFHCRLLCEWRLLVVQRKTGEAQRRSSVMMVTSKEVHLKETLLSACLRFWRTTAELHGSQRAKAQALRAAQQEMHVKTLNALRRRQESEDDAIQQLHFSAWHQHLLNAKIVQVEKEKAMAKTFGQLMLDDEMLRSRSFYQWRDALHQAREEAIHQAVAQEEKERQKEEHEKKVQVMREAFRSSSEALLSSCLLGWLTVLKRSAVERSRERLDAKRSLEFHRFLLTHCYSSWRFSAALSAVRRRKRLVAAQMAEEMLDTWQLRHVHGLCSVEARAFQAQLLELWRQAALRELHLRQSRRAQRCWAHKMCQEQMLPVADRASSLMALHHWQQLCLRLSLQRRQERQRTRVAGWLAHQQDIMLQRSLWDVWRHESLERRSQQRVAASCQNTREVQLHVRDRMLHALEMLLEELNRAGLEELLLRWRSWSQEMQWRRRMKEKGHRAAKRFADDGLLSWCSWILFHWAREAHQSRHGRLSEYLERQVSGARVVQSQMTLGWRKAISSLSREQLRCLQNWLHHILRAWCCRCAWKKRYQRQLCCLLSRSHGARDLRRWMWRWQVALLQEKSANRVERFHRHGDSFISQLRSLWLLQQTFSSWQHARAYEELFRILSETQADLAKAAEATALAETAAVAAQQRNQQVTVRVLPSPPVLGWSAPEAVSPTSPRCPLQPPVRTHLTVEEEGPGRFQAPVLSLQKDIQRHYAQRLQDLQTRGSRASPTQCSFEVNIAQRGAEAPRREAWRSPRSP